MLAIIGAVLLGAHAIGIHPAQVHLGWLGAAFAVAHLAVGPAITARWGRQAG